MSVSAIAVSSALQSLYPMMVNGYLCFNAAQAAQAREGTNPFSGASNTAKVPSAHAVTGNTALVHKAPVTPLTTSAYTVTGAAHAARPLNTGARGSLVNITV